MAPDGVHDLAVVLAEPVAGVLARSSSRRPGLLRVPGVGTDPADRAEQELQADAGVTDDRQGCRVVPPR